MNMDFASIFSGAMGFVSFIFSVAAYLGMAFGVKKAAEAVQGLKVPVWCAWIPGAQYVLLADVVSKRWDKKIGNMELWLVAVIALVGSFILSIITCGALSFLLLVVTYAIPILFVMKYAPEDKKVLYIILMIVVMPVGMFLAPKAFGMADSYF